MSLDKVYRAGLICYKITSDTPSKQDIQMLFMRPSDPDYGGDNYQIPKGKIESGETPKQAAIREAKEEVGLFIGSIINGPEEVGTFLGRTTIFVCKVKRDALFGEPHFETESVEWMTEQQFLESGRTLHKPLVSACVRKICSVEGIKE